MLKTNEILFLALAEMHETNDILRQIREGMKEWQVQDVDNHYRKDEKLTQVLEKIAQ